MTLLRSLGEIIAGLFQPYEYPWEGADQPPSWPLGFWLTECDLPDPGTIKILNLKRLDGTTREVVLMTNDDYELVKMSGVFVIEERNATAER